MTSGARYRVEWDNAARKQLGRLDAVEDERLVVIVIRVGHRSQVYHGI